MNVLLFFPSFRKARVANIICGEGKQNQIYICVCVCIYYDGVCNIDFDGAIANLRWSINKTLNVRVFVCYYLMARDTWFKWVLSTRFGLFHESVAYSPQFWKSMLNYLEVQLLPRCEISSAGIGPMSGRAIINHLMQ